MAQTYRGSLARYRMKNNRCPECGEPAEQHNTSPYFWERWGEACDLMPRGVVDRIERFKKEERDG